MSSNCLLRLTNPSKPHSIMFTPTDEKAKIRYYKPMNSKSVQSVQQLNGVFAFEHNKPALQVERFRTCMSCIVFDVCQCMYVSFITCVWDVPPGHIVACWESKLGSKGRTQTACPAACEPVCWTCGMPAAAGVSCQVGRSPFPEGNYAGSGRRRCVRMVCREAAPAAAGICGTPSRHLLPADSCKGGSPSCDGSVHTQDTEPPAVALLARLHSPRSLGCPSPLLQHNAALAQMTPEGLQSWEGAHALLSHKLQGMNRLREQMPPRGWWHITLQVRGHSKGVKQLF